jgi:2-polyprenyl-6-methoxyphenol hydroxylase-like FAD-dependent oxidoreductase
MARVLIIGGGVAGPVAAMALQRAGIDAVVHEAYAPASQEKVGSYLTVVSNGIDALRVIGADTRIRVQVEAVGTGKSVTVQAPLRENYINCRGLGRDAPWRISPWP